MALTTRITMATIRKISRRSFMSWSRPATGSASRAAARAERSASSASPSEGTVARTAAMSTPTEEAALAASGRARRWSTASIACRRPPAADLLLEVDHRLLDEVGGRALDGRVHGLALRLRPDLEVRRAQVGQPAEPAQQRPHHSRLAGAGDGVVDELAHRGIAPEVGL